jgi:hypothetical protein
LEWQNQRTTSSALHVEIKAWIVQLLHLSTRPATRNHWIMASVSVDKHSTTHPRPCPPTIKGIDHLKLVVRSLTTTRNFYTTIFPFTHIPAYDHHTSSGGLFAQILTHPPTKLLLELRYNPDQVSAQRGSDPITWAVSTRKDLEEWARWLDEHSVPHSRVLMGLKSWVMACEDPDGRIVRLYVQDEEHEWTETPDQDERWLGTVVADPSS